jgi:ABC-type sugar transport system permease subunit
LKKEKKKKKLTTFAERQNKLGYRFMLPWIIGFIIFTAIPFIATIYLSFTEVRQTVVGFEIKFIGLDNYFMAFFENVEFVPAMMEFLGMIIPYTFVIVIISFILSYLLNHIKFLKGMLRTIYFLPVIIMSGPVMYQLIDSSAQASESVPNREFTDIFIVQMIANYSFALAELLVGIFQKLSIILWFTGIPIILFINGLQKINPSLFEAASIDSANGWQILWKITIPIIKPIALVVTIFTIANLGTFSTNPVYDLIGTATENTSGGLGIASTYAWIYSFVVLIIIGIAFLIFRNREKVRRH